MIAATATVDATADATASAANKPWILYENGSVERETLKNRLTRGSGSTLILPWLSSPKIQLRVTLL